MITQHDLSMSTMWNFRAAQNGSELVDSITSLGFRQMELNYQVLEEWIPEIEKKISAGQVHISSVHNVFPKTFCADYDTDSLLLGHTDEQKRQEAVRLAKCSIDWAVHFGAKAVVFHPTQAPLSTDYDRRLKALLREGKRESEEYGLLFEEFITLRQDKRLPHLEALYRSLDELSAYVTAGESDILLGMENRSMCHQIPVYDEYESIMQRFEGSPIKIWLDTGHAIMMKELGLHVQPLSERVLTNICGVHIHDAQNGNDHDAPYSLPGDPLEAYLPILRRAPIKVLELSSRLRGEQVCASVPRLLARINGE